MHTMYNLLLATIAAAMALQESPSPNSINRTRNFFLVEIGTSNDLYYYPNSTTYKLVASTDSPGKRKWFIQQTDSAVNMCFDYKPVVCFSEGSDRLVLSASRAVSLNFLKFKDENNDLTFPGVTIQGINGLCVSYSDGIGCRSFQINKPLKQFAKFAGQ